MLLPITLQVDQTGSMIFFVAGIYYGAMYGGSTTRSCSTHARRGGLDGHLDGGQPDGQERPRRRALATAAIGSFVAGTSATIVVTLVAPLVARYAVLLRPHEYFMLMALAFVTVSAMLGKGTLRGLTSLFVGIAIHLAASDRNRRSVRTIPAGGRPRPF